MVAHPFLGTEALARGIVGRRSLRTQNTPIYRNVYLPRGADVTAATRAEAAWLWSGRTAIAGGLSAAALYGTRWIEADEPAELYRTNGKPVSGILIHRDTLHPDEIGSASSIPVTTPARTAFDLGRRRGTTLAVTRIDALAQATGVRVCDIEPLIARHRGARGLVQLRAVLDLVDGGAESPQETRTRLVLVGAGLPRPSTQIVVRRYRIDLGWEQFKVGVEYDGEQHWKDARQHARDIDRLAELSASGWRVIRVSAEILRNRRHVIVERTCAALREAGAEWPAIARILG